MWNTHHLTYFSFFLFQPFQYSESRFYNFSKFALREYIQNWRVNLKSIVECPGLENRGATAWNMSID